VTVTAAGHRQVTIRVGSSGTFSVWLPPGRYQVSGRSPDIVEVNGGTAYESPFSPLPVTVTAGHTTTVALTVIVP
jgi:hypothetical protein